MEWLRSLFDQLLVLLSQHGYLITYLATTLENLFVIGSFTPGETVVAAAAFTAGTRGGISVTGVWLASFFGTCTGTGLSFALGVRGGRAFLESVERRFRRLHGTIEAAEEYFDRHGTRSVFLARFVAVFKNVTPVLAGASRMPLPVFAGYTVAGAVTYTSIMVAVGWFLGDNFETGLRILGALGWAGFLVVVCGFVAAWWGKRRYTKRRLAALEAAHHASRPSGPEAP